VPDKTAKELMHKLWTRDVGREGYHKPDWNALDVAISQLERERDQLRDLGSRQSREIENLRCMADAVEVLRDIGKVFGCDHVDDPDGRRQLVNCIDQEFQRVNEENGQRQQTIDGLASRLYSGREIWVDRINDENLARAQAEADEHGVPVSLVVHGSSPYTAKPKQLADFEKLARRVVEIFEPMQAKGQNGHTFELLLERAKKCLASYSERSATATA
jgi:hypothetical protein